MIFTITTSSKQVSNLVHASSLPTNFHFIFVSKMKGKGRATTSSDFSLSSSSPSSSPPPAPSLKRRIKSFRRNFCSQERRPALVMTDGTAKIRSSIYRGVTRHRSTGRYEAHLWDKNYYNPVLNKRGRQVYLGAYEDEKAAAHTYDLAALKFWGPETILNFPAHTYAKEYEEMQEMTREEHLAALRRKSSGFARGLSKYRGVAQHHHNGRWEARIGRIYGNKYLYLGTFSTQEEAAKAYDMAAIEYRGPNAVTNFEMSRYLNFTRLHRQLPPSLPEPQVQPQSQPSANYNHGHELVSSQLQYDYNMANGPACDIVYPNEQKASDGIAQQRPWNMQCVANFPSLHFPDFKLGMDYLMASSTGTASDDIRCIGADHSLSPLVAVEEEDGDFDIDDILVNCDHIYSDDSAEVGDEELVAAPGC